MAQEEKDSKVITVKESKDEGTVVKTTGLGNLEEAGRVFKETPPTAKNVEDKTVSPPQNAVKNDGGSIEATAKEGIGEEQYSSLEALAKEVWEKLDEKQRYDAGLKSFQAFCKSKNVEQEAAEGRLIQRAYTILYQKEESLKKEKEYLSILIGKPEYSSTVSKKKEIFEKAENEIGSLKRTRDTIEQDPYLSVRLPLLSAKHERVKEIASKLADPSFAREDIRRKERVESFESVLNGFVREDIVSVSQRRGEDADDDSKSISWGREEYLPARIAQFDPVISGCFGEVRGYYQNLIDQSKKVLNERLEKTRLYFVVENEESDQLESFAEDSDGKINTFPKALFMDESQIVAILKGDVKAKAGSLAMIDIVADKHLSSSETKKDHLFGQMVVVFEPSDSAEAFHIHVWGVYKDPDEKYLHRNIEAAEKIFSRMEDGERNYAPVVPISFKSLVFPLKREMIGHYFVRSSLEFLVRKVEEDQKAEKEKKEREEKMASFREKVKELSDWRKLSNPITIHQLKKGHEGQLPFKVERRGSNKMVSGHVSSDGKWAKVLLPGGNEDRKKFNLEFFPEDGEEVLVEDLIKDAMFISFMNRNKPFESRWTRERSRELEALKEKDREKSEDSEDSQDISDVPVPEEISEEMPVPEVDPGSVLEPETQGIIRSWFITSVTPDSEQEEISEIVTDNASVQGTPLSQFSDFFSKKEIEKLAEAGVTTLEEFIAEPEKVSSIKGFGPKTEERFTDFRLTHEFRVKQM